jgi:hypothetical protein
MTGISLASWREALNDNGLSSGDYANREILCDEPLPWSVVDSGVSTAYLADELEIARIGTQSPPCPPRECEKCGVC